VDSAGVAAAAAAAGTAPRPPPPSGHPAPQSGSGSGSGSQAAPAASDDFPDEVICKDWCVVFVSSSSSGIEIHVSSGQSVHIALFDVHEDNCPGRKKGHRPRQR
jgi:hypothetical protein